jgi:type II secretory pathway predicted ATPase ExeA
MTIDNLTAAYGFTKMPFGRDIAPQALNQHRAHQEAVARIAWCVAESSIGVVTGECGSGKTVAARAALSALDASRHTVIYLGTPGVGLRGTYAAIVVALGGVPRFHCGSLIPQAADLLAQEAEERGKKVTVCLDEVQLCDAETLEGLRCLRNAGMDAEHPFGLILLAQPVFRRRLRLGTFTALEQRVGLRYVVGGLEASECGPYVAHHLTLCGRSDTLFSDDAIALIYQVARGLPRAVNNLATQALVAAFSLGKAIVDESAARAAFAEVTAE